MMRVGGSFAPPLSAGKLDEYATLIDTCQNQQVMEAMSILHRMVFEFGKTPKSRQPGVPHPSGVGAIVPLEKAEIERMDPHVPWDKELVMYANLFDKIDMTNKPLRDAAFHLLWYGRELFLDREPITKDTL